MAKNLEISFLLDFYGDVLTERQREVMEQYYNDDLSLAEIADNFGITRQGVRDSIKRGEGIILDLEQKVGFAARYRAVQQGVAQLESLARSIRFANSNSYSPNAEIERDVDQMLEEGLVDEVRKLKDMGCTRDMVSMKGLGYKEILAYLEGEIPFEEAVRILKRDTRHFAKRQITWFKRERDVIWVPKQEFDYDETKILEFLLENLRKRGIIQNGSDDRS